MQKREKKKKGCVLRSPNKARKKHFRETQTRGKGGKKIRKKEKDMLR